MIKFRPIPSSFKVKRGDSVFFIDEISLSVCGIDPPYHSVICDISTITPSSLVTTNRLMFTVKQNEFLSQYIGKGWKPEQLFGVELVANVDGTVGAEGNIDNSPLSAAVITLSDRGAVGKRDDATGPTVQKIIAKVVDVAKLYLIPDDKNLLRYTISELADKMHYDIIITNGGTGVSPRDTTCDITLELIEKRMRGMEQAMMAASLKETYKAVLSRAVAGIRGRSLIINLPGSPRAATTNLLAIIDAISHIIKKLNGDPSDCST